MARPTHPRSDRHHEIAASHVLERHARKTGVPVTLPVQIEQIIEITYGLEILWSELDEPPDAMILGALYPEKRRIVINERHSDWFERVMGPERFTLAHELAHWVYDTDVEGQMTLDTRTSDQETFCYHRKSAELGKTLRLREQNANRLASHLLLPADLVRAADLEAVFASLRQTAALWGVSQQTLRIRLEALGLLDDAHAAGLDLKWE